MFQPETRDRFLKIQKNPLEFWPFKHLCARFLKLEQWKCSRQFLLKVFIDSFNYKENYGIEEVFLFIYSQNYASSFLDTFKTRPHKVQRVSKKTGQRSRKRCLIHSCLHNKNYQMYWEIFSRIFICLVLLYKFWWWLVGEV